MEEDFIRRDNPEAVRRFGTVEVLGNIDYLDELEASPETAWRRFERCMAGLNTVEDALQ